MSWKDVLVVLLAMVFAVFIVRMREKKEPPIVNKQIVNKQMFTYAPLKVYTWDDAHVEEHSDGTVTLHLEKGRTQLHFAKVADALIWVRSNMREWRE